jgi:hypothetical protein
MAARKKHVHKVKRRFVPDNKGQSISLMNQAKRAMLKGEPIPPHVANYLLEVMYSVAIDGEKDAQKAFGLKRRIGNPGKTSRNILFALRVDELRNQKKMNRDDAIEVARVEFNDLHTPDAADSAYRDGLLKSAYSIDGRISTGTNFFHDIRHILGEDVYEECVRNMKASYEDASH